MEKRDILPGLGLALLAFLIGEKSVVIGKLAIVWLDALFSDGPKEKYIFQASFLALALGLSMATLTAIAADKDKSQNGAKYVTAAIIGVVGGFLEILEVMTFEVEAAGLAGSPFFFFFIFVLIFLVPPIQAVVSVQGNKDAKDRLVRIAAAIIAGFIVSLPVSVLIDLTVSSLPGLFGEKEHWRNAGGVLTFRPIAFVWMGTAWVTVAFLPNARKGAEEIAKPSMVWALVYMLAAAIAGALYVLLFLEDSDVSHFEPLLPVWLGYAVLGIAPIAGYFLAGALNRGLDSISAPLSLITTFGVTALAMSLCLASGAGEGVAAFLVACALMGVAGASIVPAIYFAQRFSGPWLSPMR